MKLPNGEFWFEAPKSQEMAEAISKALEEADIIDPSLVTRVWGVAADFRVRESERGVLGVSWSPTSGVGRVPPTKVVFQEVKSLEISVEEPVWEPPAVGSLWEGGFGGEYILIYLAPLKVGLVSLERRCRLNDGVEVGSTFKPTKEQWEEITVGMEFTQIDEGE